jgi:hypothetical protein
MKRRTVMVSVFVFVFAIGLAATTSCGGDKGGGPDKIDTATLKVGDTTTATLKFWMAERGVRGDGIADNIHFDDGDLNRVVLYFDASMKEKASSLEKNKTYKVTFKTEEIGAFVEAKMITGTLVSIE